MTGALQRFLVVLGLACLFGTSAFAQAAQSTGGARFSMGLGIGVQTFSGPDESGTYQFLSVTPSISSGNLGIGFIVTLDSNFSGSGGTPVIRRADWWPSGSATLQNVAAIYLPKIDYARWGTNGDPAFLTMGSFDDATLGDGFIMGDYNNTLFLPTERHLGLLARVNGTAFDFPYAGIDTVIGNLAALDVLGARVFARPLAMSSSPNLNKLEIGVTAVVDTNPYFETVSATGSASPVGVFGLDVLLPVLSTKDVFSLVSFADAVTIQAQNWGTMVGVRGRIIDSVTYGAQLRLMGPGFTPVYFGPGYDVQRDVQYNDLQSSSASSPTFAGLISGGISLLEDKLVFTVTFDSPFLTSETGPTLADPHLNAVLSLAPGALPIFSFDFIYDKKGIGTFGQLVDATNTIVQAKLNLQSGPAVISFVCYFTYDPRQTALTGNPWTVSSGLQASVVLF